MIFNKKDLVDKTQMEEIESKIPHYLDLLEQKTPFAKIDRHFGSAEEKKDVEQLKQKLLTLTAS